VIGREPSVNGPAIQPHALSHRFRTFSGFHALHGGMAKLFFGGTRQAASIEDLLTSHAASIP
jgi:hypothetical protein